MISFHRFLCIRQSSMKWVLKLKVWKNQRDIQLNWVKVKSLFSYSQLQLFNYFVLCFESMQFLFTFPSFDFVSKRQSFINFPPFFWHSIKFLKHSAFFSPIHILTLVWRIVQLNLSSTTLKRHLLLIRNTQTGRNINDANKIERKKKGEATPRNCRNFEEVNYKLNRHGSKWEK